MSDIFLSLDLHKTRANSGPWLTCGRGLSVGRGLPLDRGLPVGRS